MSEAYIKKLLDIQLRKLEDLNWIETIVYWIFDSRYGKAIKLNEFLSQQIDNPAKEVMDLAVALRMGTPYETVSNIEAWAYTNISYKLDKYNFGIEEYWAKTIETIGIRTGDCEDYNSLIYVLCRLAGIPASNLYCCVGSTSSAYHFWTLFFDSKRGRFVKLDSTFYPEIKQIKDKKEFKLGEAYKKIDYIFNETGIWKVK